MKPKAIFSRDFICGFLLSAIFLSGCSTPKKGSMVIVPPVGKSDAEIEDEMRQCRARSGIMEKSVQSDTRKINWYIDCLSDLGYQRKFVPDKN